MSTERWAGWVTLDCARNSSISSTNAGRVSGVETRPAQYSSHVKAVEGHYLGPRLHEVLHKLLLSVGGSIDLRHGAQLGVRAEHQVNRGRGPLERAGLAIVSLINAFGRGGLVPRVGHVEQAHEEVVRQGPGPIGEYAVLRLSFIRIEHPHAAD